MRLYLLFLASFVVLSATAQERFKVVAYMPNYADVKSLVQTIEYDKLTHINIAFENPTNEAGELSFHPTNSALIKAAHEHEVKVLVSIGGGSAAEDKRLKPRYRRLLAADARAAFAQSLLAYVIEHNFDGLDVDIEGPSITSDYGLFIEALGREFRPAGKLLTAALSQGYGGELVPETTFAHFDFINIMAYDAVPQ